MEIYLNPDNAAFTKAVCAMPEGLYGGGGKLRQERGKNSIQARWNAWKNDGCSI